MNRSVTVTTHQQYETSQKKMLSHPYVNRDITRAGAEWVIAGTRERRYQVAGLNRQDLPYKHLLTWPVDS